MSNRTVKLFSKEGSLDEKPSDFDALGYENEVKHVKMRLERLVKKNKHSIIAYLGAFGVGKSTVLREVQKQTQDYRWITFEMWRYANRNELWDAFVIKLVSELTSGKDESDIADEVEGSSLSRFEWPLVLFWVVGVWILLSIVSYMTWNSFKDGIGIGGQFWEAYFKYAAPTIFPVLILVGLGKFLQLSFITNKRPLRRVFELEGMLLGKVNRMRKPLIVVVEDVDRSSEDGAIFLETLNYFLGRLTLKSMPLIVLAPQSTQTFIKYEDNSYKGLETALKIYDEKIYFNSSVSDQSITKFYNDLGINPQWKSQLTQATQAIISAHREFITIRLLKHALREVVQFSEMNSGINPVVALTIILSRYVEVSSSTGTMRSEAAIRILDSRQSFGSGSARAFFIALALGIGKYDEANQMQEFVLNFIASSEPEFEVITRGNGSKQCNMNVSEIYRNLLLG